MQGEVTEEVLQKEEPAITVYSVEDDAIVIKELQARIKLFTDEGSATGEN